MDYTTIEFLLDQVRRQNYPLEISEDAAEALVSCLRRVMDAVPEDDQVMVRAEYDLATSALSHPVTMFGASD